MMLCAEKVAILHKNPYKAYLPYALFDYHQNWILRKVLC